MSTPDPTAPVPPRGERSDETRVLPQQGDIRPTPGTSELDPFEGGQVESGAQPSAPDAFGLPEPPDRGAQHAFGDPSTGRRSAEGQSRTEAQPVPSQQAPVQASWVTGEPGEQPVPDAFGMPEPPERGSQHAFDAPPAVPPGPGNAPPPAPPSGYWNQPPPPQPTAPTYIGGQPAPTPFPAAAPAPYPNAPGQPQPQPGQWPHQQQPGQWPQQPQPGQWPHQQQPHQPQAHHHPGYVPPSGGNATPTSAYPPPYAYSPADSMAKSRTVAGILGILLGGLGVHRFYLGYVGIGLAQIAVTLLTFGIGWIWGFIEGILYLTQRTGQFSVDATGRPLRD